MVRIDSYRDSRAQSEYCIRVDEIWQNPGGGGRGEVTTLDSAHFANGARVASGLPQKRSNGLNNGHAKSVFALKLSSSRLE